MSYDIALRRRILMHLHRRGYWGAKHTSAENALKGIAAHLIGDAKEVLDNLIKERFLIPKPAHYGLQVSLNPEMKEEIERAIHEK